VGKREREEGRSKSTLFSEKKSRNSGRENNGGRGIAARVGAAA